LTVAI
jgi:hypothetical protein